MAEESGPHPSSAGDPADPAVPPSEVPGADGAAAAATGRRLRSDAARNRVRILDAAQRVFAEHGLGASVEEVAAEAGLGVGTLYRRFATKQDLIEALVVDLLAEVARVCARCVLLLDGTGLETFLRTTAAHMAQHSGYLPRHWADVSGAESLAAVRADIGLLLEDGRRHGRVRDDVSAADVSLLLAALRGVLQTAPAAHARFVSLALAGFSPTVQPYAEPAVGWQVVDVRHPIGP